MSRFLIILIGCESWNLNKMSIKKKLDIYYLISIIKKIDASSYWLWFNVTWSFIDSFKSMVVTKSSIRNICTWEVHLWSIFLKTKFKTYLKIHQNLSNEELMLGSSCASLSKAHTSLRDMSFPLGKKGF